MPAMGNEYELVRVLGYPGFKLLLSRYGGRRIRIPSAIDRAEGLIQVMGRENAELMVDAFGGFDIEVPNGRPHVLPSRETIIKELIGRGWSNDDIIDNIGCTDRTVRRYRAELDGGNGISRPTGLAAQRNRS